MVYDESVYRLEEAKFELINVSCPQFATSDQ